MGWMTAPVVGSLLLARWTERVATPSVATCSCEVLLDDVGVDDDRRTSGGRRKTGVRARRRAGETCDMSSGMRERSRGRGRAEGRRIEQGRAARAPEETGLMVSQRSGLAK